MRVRIIIKKKKLCCCTAAIWSLCVLADMWGKSLHESLSFLYDSGAGSPSKRLRVGLDTGKGIV